MRREGARQRLRALAGCGEAADQTLAAVDSGHGGPVIRRHWHAQRRKEAQVLPAQHEEQVERRPPRIGRRPTKDDWEVY